LLSEVKFYPVFDNDRGAKQDSGEQSSSAELVSDRTEDS
jgi:hypothetical protein